MNYPLIIGIESIACLLLVVLFVVYRSKIQNKIGKNERITDQITRNETKLSSISMELVEATKKSKILKQEIEQNEKAIEETTEKKNRVITELQKLIKQFGEAKEKFNTISNDTIALQKLKANSDQLQEELKSSSSRLQQLKSEITKLEEVKLSSKTEAQELMARVDLYSRLENFVSHGLFDEPDYLYETSERFSEEIRRIREKQKELLRIKRAVTYPSTVSISSDQKNDQKILDGQVNLMLTAFNIECDYLIGKVKPSSFARTLEQIENIATKLEKSAASLHCGFNTEYVKLKFEECRLQYQYALKKQEEQEEQRIINEQIREEIKAQREFEKAIAEAEKEESMYRKLLERAKQALEIASDEDRVFAQQRIEDLEKQLAEAVAKEERAKSLAEQTRKGHVYVISNVGSFGKGVYKIGLTRRLDPMDRIRELGDASVPYKFDVHAVIHAEDAPALETSIHRAFKKRRLNAVNFRKEFFRADLHDIKKAVEEIIGNDVDFRMTALAEEYYETKRLNPEVLIH